MERLNRQNMDEGNIFTGDNYLSIARRVLQSARRPLTPREIMVEAFKSGFVPNHLHGRTQHKTLQARLSENILKQREQSAFFRTSPGRFFLREFLSDERLPVNFRTPIIARRRVRDLPKKGLLAVKRSEVEAVLQDGDLKDGELHDFFKTNRLRYLPTRHEATTDDVLVWSFVVILRGEKVLSYRQGRYREGRDTFLQKRSIGFYSLVDRI
jgi:hypothetical protein